MKFFAWVLGILGIFGVLSFLIFLAVPNTPGSCGDTSCPSNIEAALGCLLPALILCGGSAFLFRSSRKKQKEAQILQTQIKQEKDLKEEQAILYKAIQDSKLPKVCRNCGAPLGDVTPKLINGIPTIVCPFCKSRYR
jgi:hypothetical protein